MAVEWMVDSEGLGVILLHSHLHHLGSRAAVENRTRVGSGGETDLGHHGLGPGALTSLRQPPFPCLPAADDSSCGHLTGWVRAGGLRPSVQPGPAAL